MKKLAFVLLLTFCDPLFALEVIKPWVAEVFPGAEHSAAYMNYYNPSNKIVKIVSASSPVAKVVEIHTHLNENGQMKMRKVDSVLVPAKGFVEFKMMGYHLMLIGLKKDLKAGDKIPFEVKLANGKTVKFKALVKKIN